MTSSNGTIFRVTGPLCGEFTGPGEFPAQRPVMRSFDVFFDLHPNKRLSKQPWGWWFETPSWSLWRQCNVILFNLVLRISHMCMLPLILHTSYTMYFHFPQVYVTLSYYMHHSQLFPFSVDVYSTDYVYLKLPIILQHLHTVLWTHKRYPVTRPHWWLWGVFVVVIEKNWLC